MNAGVQLVQAYLTLNGYFTVADVPVIRLGSKGAYRELTDLDVIGIRFPHAAHVVPVGEPGPHDDIRLPVDPELHVNADLVDVIIAEVKEGKPQLNAQFRSQDALERALARVGLVEPPDVARVVAELQETGRSRVEGTADARIRLMAFGVGTTGPRQGYSVISLRRAASWVSRMLKDYHHIVRPARIEDPFMGILHFLEKIAPQAPRGAALSNPERVQADDPIPDRHRNSP